MASTIKTTGAEWKRFIAEPWPDDKYTDDTLLEVDGEEVDGAYDDSRIPDGAVVKIVAGVIYDGDRYSRSLVAEFQQWRRHQNTETFTVTVDKDKVAAVKAAIRAAGGKFE